MSARADILSRLRAAPTAAAPTAEAVDAAIAAHYRTYRTVSPPARRELVEQFIARSSAWRAEVRRTTRAGWLAALRDVVAAKGIRRLLYAPGSAHGAALAADTTLAPHLLPFTQPLEECKETLFTEADAAITGTRGAIAATGSLIVWPDGNEPRLMSLLPPIHLALVDATRIVPTFFDAIASQGWKVGLPSNALLITGPSKTADIQQTLAYGAHGPKELLILLIEEDE